jgi:hypothetical protein
VVSGRAVIAADFRDVVGTIARMKIPALLIALLIATAAFAQTKATTAPTTAESVANIGAVPPPDAPLPPNMTRIFDGKSLDGWKQFPADSWVVKNGVLASLGVARGLMWTTKDYARYRVVFDVRHVSGKPDHRAGVLVFCNGAAVDAKDPSKPSPRSTACSSKSPTAATGITARAATSAATTSSRRSASRPSTSTSGRASRS